MGGLTRRRLLRIAGASAWASACSQAARGPATIVAPNASPAPIPAASPRASATSSPPASPAASPSTTAERARLDADVLVIGAGLAGMAAARKLGAAGVSVVVLEGRNRPGGRVFTDASAGVPLDLGGAHARDVPADPIRRVSAEFSADSTRIDRDARALFATPERRLSPAQSASLAAARMAIRSALTAASARASPGTSLADVIPAVVRSLALSEPLATALEATITADYVIAHGDNLDKIGVAGWQPPATTDGLMFPRGSAEWLVKLAGALPIRFGWRVSRINWDAGGVRAADRRVAGARKAIVTVPLGVLQNGRIEFSPDLPEAHWRSIRALRMGSVARIGLVFPTAFWDADVQVFQVAQPGQQDFLEFWNWQIFTGKPVLMAVAAGRYARQLETFGFTELMLHVMRDLRQAFGSRAVEPVSAINAGWDSDPFAFGSMSLHQPGSSAADNRQCAQPVNNTLFFAGEHTHAAAPGTMHGAWLSGERAADEVLAALSRA